MAMSMEDMVGALASMTEEKRRTMMSERLDMFAGMAEEARRAAMKQMTEGVVKLGEADRRKLIRTRTVLLCDMPDAKRRTLMTSHTAVLQEMGQERMMAEMKLVQSIIPELSRAHQQIMEGMMKMMPMPAMAMGAGGMAAMGAQRARTAEGRTWGLTCTWIAALLGVWLIVAPFVLGHQVRLAALWNDIILGVGIAILSGAVAIARPDLREGSWPLPFVWISALAGIWLILAPFILGYTAVSTALGGDIVVGLAVAILAGAVAVGRPDLS